MRGDGDFIASSSASRAAIRASILATSLRVATFIRFRASVTCLSTTSLAAIPFFSISTNLTRARIDVDSRGPLWRAVRKSMSIPGVFPPIIENGDVVVDGGVVDNFPVERMSSRPDCGTVIGVNVAPAVDKVKPYVFGPALSGWRVLRSRILPWTKRLRAPSLVGSLLRTQEINSVMAIRSGLRFVDLLVEPAVDHVRMHEYNRHVELIAAGYDSGRKALAENPLRP